MNFSDLRRIVKTAETIADTESARHRLVESLSKTRGPVLLISGELHPGTYNNSMIGEAVHELLTRIESPIRLCWGPVTFFASEENNEFYSAAVLRSLSAQRLSVLCSRRRQPCHLWLVGDDLFFHRPHRYAAGFEEKRCVYGRVAGEKVWNNIDRYFRDEMKRDRVFDVEKNREELDRAFRKIEVEVSRGIAQRYVNPAFAKEAEEYFVSWAKQRRDICAIQSWIEGECVDIAVHSDGRMISLDKIRDFEVWTRDRFPELQISFYRYETSVDSLERIKRGEHTVYFRY